MSHESACALTCYTGTAARAAQQTQAKLVVYFSCKSNYDTTDTQLTQSYSCRDCSYSWCTDCIEEGHTLLDDELPQFAALGFPADERSTYIVCKLCTVAAVSLVTANAPAQNDSPLPASVFLDEPAVPLTPILERTLTTGTPQTLKRNLDDLGVTDGRTSPKNARVAFK